MNKKLLNLTAVIMLLTLFGCRAAVTETAKFSVVKNDDQTAIITPENVEIYFPDGFDVPDLTDKTTISFGPVGDDQKTRLYNLVLLPPQPLSDVMARFKEIPEILIYNPDNSVINGYRVVKVIEAGYCEKRIAQVIGQKLNIQLYSQNCSRDRDLDFNYFDKIINTITPLK